MFFLKVSLDTRQGNNSLSSQNKRANKNDKADPKHIGLAKSTAAIHNEAFSVFRISDGISSLASERKKNNKVLGYIFKKQTVEELSKKCWEDH